MDNGVARIPSSGSRSGSRLPSGDQAANAARGQTASAASGRSLGNPLGLTNPLNAQADAAGVPNPGQHHVPAQDAAARTWRAQSHRQRFLAGLRSAVSCTNASAVSTTLSPEQTIDAWLSWAQMPHAALYEKRDDAAQRVIASVMGEGQDPHSLNLAGLGLRGELPPLPEHLTRLTIARNPGITTLASIPASLIRLNADRCGLVQLPAFPEGSQLQELNVSYNPQLHTLPPLPPSLIELEANHCGLRQLPPFSEGSQLQRLNLISNSQLQTLPPLPAPLMRLQVANCGLRQLPPFPQDSQLQELNVNVNRHLAALPAPPVSLRLLNAGGCKFRHLPPFPEGSQLQELNVNGNRHLLTLPPLPPSLMRLHATHCGLVQLPPFPQWSQLQRLVVHGNRQLQTLPPLPAPLVQLRVENCGLEQLPPFPEGSRLQELNVASNPQLFTLPLLPPSLIRLHAQKCGLGYLPPFPERSQLRELTLDKNFGLQTLPPLPAPLVRLQASGCNLHQLPPFPEHSQLEHLDIGDNRLARIPPLPQSLRVLVANKNSASHLQSLILPDLPRWLTRVDLSACNLTELPALPENLEHANFARNRISTLSQPTQPSVTWLKVSDNPIAELPEWVLLLSPQAEVRLSKEYMSKRAYQTITRQVMAARTEGTGPRFIATGWSDFGVEEDIGFWR